MIWGQGNINIQCTALLLETIDQNLTSESYPAARDWKTDLFWGTMCPAKLRVCILEEEEEMGIRGQSVFSHNRDVSLGQCGCEDHNLSVIPYSAT